MRSLAGPKCPDGSGCDRRVCDSPDEENGPRATISDRIEVWLVDGGRAVRSQVLVVRELPYVDAARVVGARTSRILCREVLPSMWSILTVMTGLMLADVILVEASLSFLGLGDPNRASWGRMASDAQQYLRVAWWLALFPGIAIVIAVVGVNSVVDGWKRK